MMISLIPINKKDSLKVKIEIYHQTIKVITKDIFKSLFSFMIVSSKTTLEKAVIEGVLIIYANRSVQ